jgi:4-deoxy-L-threo-5-hexosulose-uronate ketol-isomerase
VQFHYFPTPEATNTLSTGELRSRFLISDLFQAGALTVHYTDLDRMIIGAALPESTSLALPIAKETGTNFFLERREIGILNLGQEGHVRVGATTHTLGHLDCLYVGQGEKDVLFVNGASGQAQFYFVSTPAHRKHATAVVRHGVMRTDPIGDAARANRRRIHKLIHPEGLKSSQLVMGFTEFEPGSVWNTMPPHTHSRRTEIYLYFDLGPEVVFHVMGEPHATRHLVVRDREAVLSPAWSVHCGAGTGAYRFIWAMAGENQAFADMDVISVENLR